MGMYGHKTQMALAKIEEMLVVILAQANQPDNGVEIAARGAARSN